MAHQYFKTIDSVVITKNTDIDSFIKNMDELGYYCQKTKLSNFVYLLSSYDNNEHVYSGKGFSEKSAQSYKNAQSDAIEEYLESSDDIDHSYDISDYELVSENIPALSSITISLNTPDTKNKKNILTYALFNFESAEVRLKVHDSSYEETKGQSEIFDKIQNGENLSSEEASELSNQMQINSISPDKIDESITSYDASTASILTKLQNNEELTEEDFAALQGDESLNRALNEINALNDVDSSKESDNNLNSDTKKNDIKELAESIDENQNTDEFILPDPSEILNDDIASENSFNSAESGLKYDEERHIKKSEDSSNTKIKKIKKNNLGYKPIKVDDVDSTKSSLNNFAQSLGDVYPLIELNDHIFTGQHIISMELLETGFVPKISILMNDIDGILSTILFPTSNCTLKLYLKSKNPYLKSVRCDFIIESMIPTMSNSSIKNEKSKNAIGAIYRVTGSMKIPRMFNTEINAYSGSSYEVLQKIADDLKLGFSTNETLTNDSMTWIQPNERFDTFIQDIVQRSYKDEDSFYSIFVDIYGNLTFVNYANQLSQTDNPDTAFGMESMSSLDLVNSITSNRENEKDPDTAYAFFLTNYSMAKGTPSFVRSLTTKTNQGSTMMYSPRTKNISYYDIQQSNENKKKFVSYDAKPVDLIKSKENIDENIATIWDGMETGNVHSNYIYSKHNNLQNFNELNKCTATIVTDGINLNIIRGMRIPVYIFREDDGIAVLQDKYINSKRKDKQNEESSKKEEDIIELDEKNSGYYIVKDIKIIYNSNETLYPSKFITEMTMYRSNWPENDVNMDSTDDESLAVEKEMESMDAAEEAARDKEEKIKEHNRKIEEERNKANNSEENSSDDLMPLTQQESTDEYSIFEDRPGGDGDPRTLMQTSEYVVLADGTIRKRKNYKAKQRDPEYNIDEFLEATKAEVDRRNAEGWDNSGTSTPQSSTNVVAVTNTQGVNSVPTGNYSEYYKVLGKPIYDSSTDKGSSANQKNRERYKYIISKNENQLLANLVKMKDDLKSYGYSMTLNCTTGGEHAAYAGANATHDIGAKADMTVYKDGKKLTAKKPKKGDSHAVITRDDLTIIHNCAVKNNLKSQFEWGGSDGSGWIDLRLNSFIGGDGNVYTKDNQFYSDAYYYLIFNSNTKKYLEPVTLKKIL